MCKVERICINPCYSGFRKFMMTSSNGKIFRVTGHLREEFTGHRWIPRTKASDVELWCLRLNKRLSKQSWGWWFETLSRPLWRHCNVELWVFSPPFILFSVIVFTYQSDAMYLMFPLLDIFITKYGWCGAQTLMRPPAHIQLIYHGHMTHESKRLKYTLIHTYINSHHYSVWRDSLTYI